MAVKVQKRHRDPKLKLQSDNDTQTGQEGDRHSTHCPKRERKSPQYVKDYECKVMSDDQTLSNVDHCCREMHNVPQTFKEATSSSESEIWTTAIKEEIIHSH